MRGSTFGTGRGLEPGTWLGPECASLDPVGEGGDLVGLEFFLGGHPHLPFVADRLDQRAFLGFARHDGRPGSPPLSIAARTSSLSPPLCFSAP